MIINNDFNNINIVIESSNDVSDTTISDLRNGSIMNRAIMKTKVKIPAKFAKDHGSETLEKYDAYGKYFTCTKWEYKTDPVKLAEKLFDAIATYNDFVINDTNGDIGMYDKKHLYGAIMDRFGLKPNDNGEGARIWVSVCVFGKARGHHPEYYHPSRQEISKYLNVMSNAESDIRQVCSMSAKQISTIKSQISAIKADMKTGSRYDANVLRKKADYLSTSISVTYTMTYRLCELIANRSYEFYKCCKRLHEFTDPGIVAADESTLTILDDDFTII